MTRRAFASYPHLARSIIVFVVLYYPAMLASTLSSQHLTDFEFSEAARDTFDSHSGGARLTVISILNTRPDVQEAEI